jgi:hypothetical protein
MSVEKSEGHISFNSAYEYFWSVDGDGKRVVVKARISNPIDPLSKQRVGARFEGTESWFHRFGNSLLDSSNLLPKN